MIDEPLIVGDVLFAAHHDRTFWVNRLIQWRRENYKDETPCGPRREAVAYAISKGKEKLS